MLLSKCYFFDNFSQNKLKEQHHSSNLFPVKEKCQENFEEHLTKMNVCLNNTVIEILVFFDIFSLKKLKGKHHLSKLFKVKKKRLRKILGN